VAAWHASAVREGVMGLKLDDDWFSTSWSVHVSVLSVVPSHSSSQRLRSFTISALLVGKTKGSDSMAPGPNCFRVVVLQAAHRPRFYVATTWSVTSNSTQHSAV